MNAFFCHEIIYQSVFWIVTIWGMTGSLMIIAPSCNCLTALVYNIIYYCFIHIHIFFFSFLYFTSLDK